MQHELSTLAGREFKVAVGVGTVITIMVGLIFIFLGASIDDAPPVIPSAPVWVGTLLLVDSLALMVAWGGLTLYSGVFHRDSPRLNHPRIVLGLVAGVLVGVLLVIAYLVLDTDPSDSSSRQGRRGERR